MGAAEQLDELTDLDISLMMEHAGGLVLDPRIEPVARALKTLLDHHGRSPLDLIVALTLIAASSGAARSSPHDLGHTANIQKRVIDLTYGRHVLQTPRTLH